MTAIYEEGTMTENERSNDKTFSTAPIKEKISLLSQGGRDAVIIILRSNQQ